MHVLKDIPPYLNEKKLKFSVSCKEDHVGSVVSKINATDRENGTVTFIESSTCFCPFSLLRNGTIIVKNELLSQVKSHCIYFVENIESEVKYPFENPEAIKISIFRQITGKG